MNFKDFKKPYSIFSTSLALMSIAISICLYIISKDTKGISYHIDKHLSAVYDKNSSFTTKLSEAIAINDSVSEITGVIWNTGTSSITYDDVRRNLSINLRYVKKIIKFKIVKQTDSDIDRFLLFPKDNQTLTISWKHFDQGYAFKFQIEYIGSVDPGFLIKGEILGVDGFDEVPDMDRKNHGIAGVSIMFGILLFVIMVILFTNSFNYCIKSIKTSKRGYFYLLLLIMGLIICVFVFAPLYKEIFFTRVPFSQ